MGGGGGWAPELGYQKIINDINPKEQAMESAPHPIITFRILKNHPQHVKNITRYSVLLLIITYL